MLFHLRQHTIGATGESGFVLVLSLVVLLMLSLFGAWALQTSTSELKVAGGEQQIEKQFNIAEGAANSEAGKLGFSIPSWYKITFDPTAEHNKLLFPLLGSNDFNPGLDVPPADAALTQLAPTTWPNPNNWPWGNLLRNITADPNEYNATSANLYDYRYLVTYLYSDVAPMGYDPSSFTAYKFRIQGNTARTAIVVELGGTKVGVKASL